MRGSGYGIARQDGAEVWSSTQQQHSTLCPTYPLSHSPCHQLNPTPPTLTLPPRLSDWSSCGGVPLLCAPLSSVLPTHSFSSPRRRRTGGMGRWWGVCKRGIRTGERHERRFVGRAWQSQDISTRKEIEETERPCLFPFRHVTCIAFVCTRPPTQVGPYSSLYRKAARPRGGTQQQQQQQVNAATTTATATPCDEGVRDPFAPCDDGGSVPKRHTTQPSARCEGALHPCYRCILGKERQREGEGACVSV